MNTKQTEALKLALEALEHEAEIGNDDAYRPERDAIREALAVRQERKFAMNKKDEALKLALEALAACDDFLFNYHDCEPNNEREVDAYSEVRGNNMKAWEAVREALAHAPTEREQPAQDNTYSYAKNLAEAIFKQHFASDEHYASGQIVWGVNDTVIGILTQIDNMVTDMVRRPAQQQEPVAWATPMDFFNKLDKHQDELRRLHEENQSLNKCLFQMQEAAKKLENQLGEAVWNYGEKVRANQELLETLKLALEALNRNDYLGWQTNIHVRQAIRAAIAKGEQA